MMDTPPARFATAAARITTVPPAMNAAAAASGRMPARFPKGRSTPACAISEMSRFTCRFSVKIAEQKNAVFAVLAPPVAVRALCGFAACVA